MAHCVNKSSKEFTDLAEKSKVNPFVLAADISLWQEQNGLDKFPTLKELNLQIEELPSSKLSKETINKIKALLPQMGISLQGLSDYLSGNPDIKISGGINGLADMVSKTIAIAMGKEEVTLAEEFVHIATSMLEQTDSKLVTALISKIERYKIYKLTFDAYKGNKNYQLSNGKPDIRKIKKEAVDKLIAEHIVKQSEGSTEFPELMEENERNIINGWWNTILEYVRSLYGKAKIDLFAETGERILEGNISTEGPLEDDIFYQIGQNTLVDKYFDTINNIDLRTKLNPETVNDKRHYTFDEKRVAKSVTEKTKVSSSMPDRTEAEKVIDDQKRIWGSEGHRYIEEHILNNLIDKDGYKKKPIFTAIESPLSEDMKEKIEIFCSELISSYAPGTRFMIEKKVVNQREKGLLASTIDFIALEPITKADGTEDIRVDILDWKFTDINKDREEDIPWYKQKDWKPQMGEYTKIMYEYGIKPAQVRKSRMIPFIMNYVDIVHGDSKSGKRPSSIEIGNLDNVKETKLYLLPVPTTTESSGNEHIDDLLKSLRSQYEKLIKKKVSPEQRSLKTLQLGELSKSIRTLQVALNFSPLVSVGKSFINSSRSTIDSFKNIDYSKLSKEEIEGKLAELLEFKVNAAGFTLIDEAYISQFGDQNLSDAAAKTLTQLKHISSSAKARLNEVLDLQKEYVTHLAVRENYVNENNKSSLFDAEREITGLVKTFVEGSKLPAKLINFTSNLIMRTKRTAERTFINKFAEFSQTLLPLEKIASTRGVTAFSLIGEVNKDGLLLTQKTDSKFWKDYMQAKEDENKKFFIDNMDMEIFNKVAKESIDKGIKELEFIEFSQDKNEDSYLRNARIKRLKNSVDINRKDFNGYGSYLFGHAFNQAFDENQHLSEEYKIMAQTPEVLKAWEFFTELNNKAKGLGYIDKQGMTFFPLIEASIIDKLNQSTNLGGELKHLFTNLYTTSINEEQVYGKKDEETGEITKTIPKYFTKRGNVPVERLSTDLNKVGALWIKALMDYEARRSIENTLTTVQAVERAKGSLIVNEHGNLVSEGGKAKVNKDVNKNADILEAIVNDALFDLQEDLGAMGNVKLTSIATKLKGDQEKGEATALSIRKGLKNADMLTRSLAVGLKATIGFANYMGYNFHAMILGGDMYRKSEFLRNQALVWSPTGLTNEDKALLHYVTIGGENVMDQMRRKAAKEKSMGAYLSTWSFTDVMMLTNSFPEYRLVLANAKSFNDNAIIIDGKIVNARQFLKKQDRVTKYDLSVDQRQALESSFDARVKELISKSTKLTDAVRITDSQISVEGVSEDEITKYSLKVSEFGRKLNGQMNMDNKAGYRRDTIFSSFMMFKNWIPKLVHSRTEPLKKNLETEDWEYGRMRVMAKIISEIGFRNISKIAGIVNGSEEGLEIMREILEAKKQEYFLRTGQELDISEEEFFDLIRSELMNSFKELGTLLMTLGAVLAISAAKPPEDASELEKNRYKLWARLINKMNDEISFYYNPASMESITKGSILPSLGLITKVGKVLGSFTDEMHGVVTDNQKIIDKSHPLKYFFNLIPGLAQFQNEYLPYIDPELAKAQGIKVTEQSRR